MFAVLTLVCGLAASLPAFGGQGAASQGECHAVEVRSPSGHFTAQIAKAPGQERVSDALARWRLTVRETEPLDGSAPWTCAIAHRPGDRWRFLAEDGRSYVEVEPVYSASRPLVRVWGPAGERFALSAAQLDLEQRRTNDAQPPWLKAEHGVTLEWQETPRGPVQVAHFTTLAGAERWLDLETGDVRASAALDSTPLALPDAALAGVNVLAAPYVKNFDCAAQIHWGEALEVRVSGSHPTPNWRNVGFQLERSGERNEVLRLLPMSSPPPANSPQLQVLQGYHATAQIVGLAPGRYTLRVEGRGDEQPAERSLEVLPARPALWMRTRGGIAGVERSVRLYRGGVAVVESKNPSRDPRITLLAPREVARLEDLLRQAEKDAPAGRSGVVDAFEHELSWRSGERDLVRSVESPGELGAAGELARVLQALYQ